MNKRKIIIIALIILIAVVGGFFAYKKIYHKPSPQSQPQVSADQLAKLLVFQNKNSNLPSDALANFQDQFNQIKDALQKNPDDFNSVLALGVLKKALMDYDGSRDAFLYGAQIRPKSSPPYANLADLYGYFLNQPDKAEEAIKTAIANDPTDVSYYLSLADLYRYKLPGKEPLFETTLLDALNKFPDNVDIISTLATYYRQANQIQKAIDYYEKLVKLAPQNQQAQIDLSALKAAANK